MKKAVLILVCICLLFSNCSSNDNLNALPQTITTKTFEIKTPSGWEFIEDQGTDTYIGRIKNDTITIYFDQGFLSFSTLDAIEQNESTIYFNRLKINGIPAVIHKENRLDGVFTTRLSIYIYNGENQEIKNRLYVLDSTNDDLILKIFKTQKFL